MIVNSAFYIIAKHQMISCSEFACVTHAQSFTEKLSAKFQLVAFYH